MAGASKQVMRLKLKCRLLVALALTTLIARAETLELRNGSLIKGKFLGGTETEISFQMGSTVQKFSVDDVVSIRFDSEGAAYAPAPQLLVPGDSRAASQAEMRPAYVTIPAGTQISVRTIDAIDSKYDFVGERFQASFEEPLTLNGSVVIDKDTLVYGRLTQSKESGTFTGKSQLSLELTGIVVSGTTIPIVTGEYEAIGKSRGASTAKRTVGGAALGALIGAVADGGQGAAIGAGVGAGAGAGSEMITRGDQVRVPSETVLDFTLQQDLSVPKRQSE